MLVRSAWDEAQGRRPRVPRDLVDDSTEPQPVNETGDNTESGPPAGNAQPTEDQTARAPDPADDDPGRA